MYKGGHPLVYIMCNTRGNGASTTCASVAGSSVAGYSADRVEPVCKKLGLLFAPPMLLLAPARAPVQAAQLPAGPASGGGASASTGPATGASTGPGAARRARPARRGHHPPPSPSGSSGVRGLARSKRSITAPIWAL